MFNYRFYRFLRIWGWEFWGRRLPIGTDGLALLASICTNGHLCLSILYGIICFIWVSCSWIMVFSRFQDFKISGFYVSLLFYLREVRSWH